MKVLLCSSERFTQQPYMHYSWCAEPNAFRTHFFHIPNMSSFKIKPPKRQANINKLLFCRIEWKMRVAKKNTLFRKDSSLNFWNLSSRICHHPATKTPNIFQCVEFRGRHMNRTTFSIGIRFLCVRCVCLAIPHQNARLQYTCFRWYTCRFRARLRPYTYYGKTYTQKSRIQY